MRTIAILALAFVASHATAQDAVLLQERLVPGVAYHVISQVQIDGSIKLPPDKDNIQGQTLPIKGTSSLDYDERILAEKAGKIDRTVRYYRRMDFERKVGDTPAQNSLRPEVRRLVILRHNQFEVPFSPSGPMTWNELDLIRTDVFSPALQGLLPNIAIKPGASWKAENGAVQELTDLEQITSGGLKCEFIRVTDTPGKPRQAQVAFQGNVRGIGEDGPTQHDLEGQVYFDLDGRYLSFIYVKGVQTLLDKAGQPNGKIVGTFTMSRQPLTASRELSDDALRGQTLEPNDENTVLLFDNPEAGVRFLYPRRWRVGEVKGAEIRLEEKNGNGLVILLEPLAKQPSGTALQQSVGQWLTGQQAKAHQTTQVQALRAAPNELSHFAVDADMKGQRVWLDYFLVRQSLGAATISSRIVSAQGGTLRPDVQRIAYSLAVTGKQ